MTDALVKYSDEIYAADGFVKLAPAIHFPVRSTVVKLSGGGLLVHSPIAFTDEQAAAIERLGEVRYVLAPNLYHNLFLASAAARFPGAKVLGAPGMDRKVKNVAFDEIVESELPASLASDFDLVQIGGVPSFNEMVLFHRSSRSLLVADYFFNIQESKGWMTPWVLRMTGSYKKATQSKLWRKATKDREAMAQSAREVLALDFQRVVMCHGEVVEDGRDFAQASLQWLGP